MLDEKREVEFLAVMALLIFGHKDKAETVQLVKVEQDIFA